MKQNKKVIKRMKKMKMKKNTEKIKEKTEFVFISILKIQKLIFKFYLVFSICWIKSKFMDCTFCLLHP